MPAREDIVVRVDHALCVGNAMCRSLAPATFVANENGQSEVGSSQADGINDLFEAAMLCPVGAITLEDSATGQRLEAP